MTPQGVLLRECLNQLRCYVDALASYKLECLFRMKKIFVSLWHDLTAGLIYEMVTASQLSITLNIKNKCI